MEMKKYKLGEICRIASARRIFENEYVAAGIPFIRGQEVSDGSLTNPKSKFQCYISKKRFEELKKEYGIPKKGDILITAVGTIGNLCYLDKDIDFYFKDGNLIWFSDFKEDILSEYLYFFMKGDYFKKQLNHTLIGAVQKALTMEKLSKIEIIVPPLPTQQKIAAVLSSLDKKIALNSRINARLEQMAKRLYEHYFVQFDFPTADGKPYKTSGGKMVYSSELKREIPEGWEVKSLFDVSDVIYGFPYATEPFDEDVEKSEKPYSVIRIRDILENTISAKTTEVVEEKYKTQIGDLLIGMDGYFHMNFWSRNGDYVNQRITRIRKTYISTLILYHQILPFIKFKEERAKGSTVGHLSDKDIKQIKVLIPDNKNISNEFDSILNLIMKNRQKNKNLSRIRDRLLPLLMNGQVSV